jgi:YVTN family beta-propeller protein
MKKINSIGLFVFAIILFTTSCKKTETFEIDDIKDAKGFYIINEGSFSLGNASLSFYDFDKATVSNSLFEGINNRPLGDVFQNLKFNDGKGYLIVNNSKKIEVVDSASMKSIRTIEGFNSPRNIYFKNGKAYVTDLYSNEITILDGNTLEKIGAIPVVGSTEDIVETNDKLIVAVNQSFEYTNESLQGILVIDSKKDIVEKYVKLSEGAVDLEFDINGDIWVYCTGFWGNNASGKLYKVNGYTYKVSQTFDFGKLAYYGNPLRFNNVRNQIYYAIGGDAGSYTDFDIYSMPINSTSLPTTPFYDSKNEYMYGYNIDEFRNELFVLDAIDGAQKGEMSIIDLTTKTKKASFEVGYFPSNIVFKY